MSTAPADFRAELRRFPPSPLIESLRASLRVTCERYRCAETEAAELAAGLSASGSLLARAVALGVTNTNIPPRVAARQSEE